MFISTIKHWLSMKEAVINEFVINCIVTSNLYEIL